MDIGDSPNVNASQNGDWTVNIGNADPIPVTTESIQRTPFQYYISTEIGDGPNLAEYFAVPSDKLLVIETVSFKAALTALDAGGYPPEVDILIQEEIGSSDAIFTLETPPSPGIRSGGWQYYSNCEQVRIYVNPGWHVVISISAGDPTLTGLSHFSLSGYTLPAGSTVLSP